MADKTLALARLHALQLPTPPSARVSAEGLAPQLAALLAQHSDVEHWYLRFDERLAPGLPRVAATENLLALLEAACRLAPQLQVIVQERVRAALSGVLAVIPDAVLVEYVQHELQALLRLGVTPSRLLYRCDHTPIAAQANAQERHYQWRGLEFVGAPLGCSPSPLPAAVEERLLASSRGVAEPAVLEWIAAEDGRLVFLDYRAMPAGFLIGASALGQALAGGALRNFERPPGRGKSSQALRLDRPLHSYAETVLEAADHLIFEAGGILSHLCVYAADQQVYCEIAPSERVPE